MQLDHLAVEILKKVATEPGMTIKMLCERIGLPQRNFYYRRTRIDDWLIAEGCTPLRCDPPLGVRLQENETPDVMQKLGRIDNQHYKLSVEERRDNLLLHLVCNTLPAFTQQLSELNHTSRNTTLNDLVALKHYIQERHPLALEVSKKQGYQIKGSALARRLAVMPVLSRALRYADHQAKTRIAQILRRHIAANGIAIEKAERAVEQGLAQVEAQLACVFTDKERRSLHYMMLFNLVDTLKGNIPEFTPAQRAFLRAQPECEAAASLNSWLVEVLASPDASGNTLFLSLLLSASKKITPYQNANAEDGRLMAAIERLIVQFQSLSGVYLQDKAPLSSRLYSHLGPAIRRCLFGLQNENVLREEILLRYPLIFRLCRQVIGSLEQEYQVAFDDDELSYIAISFAAWLDRRPETTEQCLLLVTEGGLTSTAILENQLRNLTVLPLHIQTLSVSQLQQQGIAPNIRIVVSTIALTYPIPEQMRFIQTHHMLTEGEKQQLRLMLERRIENSGISELVNALVASALRPALQHKEPLQQAFTAIISNFIHKQQRLPPQGAVTGVSILPYIHFTARQSGWRQTIHKCAKPLVEKGIIDSHYVRNIIRQIEVRGVTTYLSPDIVLLHDAPPPGVTMGALSLLKLRHPLRFDLPEVSLTPRLIVILVPTRDLSHIPLLASLNALISDEGALDALLQASSQREVRQHIDDNAVYQSRV